jgi:hypothetical protein
LSVADFPEEGFEWPEGKQPIGLARPISHAMAAARTQTASTQKYSYMFNQRSDPNAFIETVCRTVQFPPLTFDALIASKP